MYFHLIWIKEKNWEKYDLDLLLQWWDENFIRKFLAYRWVVVVSLTKFEGNESDFWNIVVLIHFENSEIQIVTPWEKLEDKVYFFISLWITPDSINFINNPLSDWEVQEIIQTTLAKIEEESERIKREKERQEIKEKKKYSESAIDDTLKVINLEINHIEQVIKAWNWILSWPEMKKLEEVWNEMKKIRLGTNFNRMASLILDAHELSKKAEREILAQDETKYFLIDNNSVTTNVDFIKELSSFNRVTEKAVVQPIWLTTDESFRNILWLNSVYLRMLLKDFSYAYKETSIDDFFSLTMNFLEYIILIIIVTLSFLRLIRPLFWLNELSLYLLPALWRLNLLIYLFNSLRLKWLPAKIIWFVVLAFVYWYGLLLLNGTFSL